MQEVGHRLGKVPNLCMTAKTDHVRVQGLLPLKRAPPCNMSSATAMFMSDLGPASRTSPDVGLDSSGHTPP